MDSLKHTSSADFTSTCSEQWWPVTATFLVSSNGAPRCANLYPIPKFGGSVLHTSWGLASDECEQAHLDP